MRGVTGEHYFSTQPAADPHRREVTFEVEGREYTLISSSGVFSAGRLDPGTAVLLRKADAARAGDRRRPAGPRLRLRPDRLRAGQPRRRPRPSTRSTSTPGRAS